MYKDYDVYKLAIKVLGDVLDSVVKCQKDMIAFHQAHIDSIKGNTNLSEQERNQAIGKYLTSIEDIHHLLIDNNVLINAISDKTEALSTNLDKIVASELLLSNPTTMMTNNVSIEDRTRNLRQILNSEYAKLSRVLASARAILKVNNEDDGEIKRLLAFECQKLSRLFDEVCGMLEGISFNTEVRDRNIEIEERIKKIIRDEQNRAEVISTEANRVMNLNQDTFIYSQDYDSFCEFIRSASDGIVMKLSELDYIINDLNTKNPTKLQKLILKLVKEVMEEESRRVNSSLAKLLLIQSKRETLPDEENEDEEKAEISRVIDEESRRLSEYASKLQEILSDLKSDKNNVKDIINRLSKSYSEESTKMNEASDKIDSVLRGNELKEKEKDTNEYKKYCSILNKSFWEARQKASNEHIKYPSALYEQKVSEYQNDYLIENYNLSLEEVENAIEQYKDKYAEDLFIDGIYNQAISILRDETDASMQELCDESAGLSILDKKVYYLLELELANVIKEIGKAKKEENIEESLAINEYRRSFKISKLLDRKDIIERHMKIIIKRAKKLEKED